MNRDYGLSTIILTIGPWIWLGAPAKAQPIYQLDVIAETGGEFSHILSTPSINNNGTVVFTGRRNGEVGIFASSGGDATAVVDTSGPFSNFVNSPPDINDNGTVAFNAQFDGGTSQGIFTVSGGITTTIADRNGPFQNFYGGSLTVNESGTVAFASTLDSGEFGIFTGNGGAITTIADTGGPFRTLNFPVMNDSGTVVFTASLDAGGDTVLTGNGGALTTVADGSGQFNTLGVSSINNAETVAFTASLDDGTVGVFASTNGTISTISDDSDLLFPVIPVINNLGAVAFDAFLNSGGTGILVGDDVVIPHGQPLLGSTATFFQTSTASFNDSGQLAFLATLADFRTAIVRATPDVMDEAPEILGSSDFDGLWPPNHKMVDVGVQIHASDDLTPISDLFESLSVTVSSNEPDSRNPGDPSGDVHGSDGFIAPADVSHLFQLNDDTGLIEGTINLRSERFGSGDGRIYSLEATIADVAGNESSLFLDFPVPHDLGAVQTVPEPSASILFGFGACVFFGVMRRTRT